MIQQNPKSTQRAAAAICAVTLLGGGMSHGAITVVADPDYDTGAPVFSTDPEANSPASRGLAAPRQLRMSFQPTSTFDVGSIVFSLAASSTASGIDIEIFEVADVNSTTWNPGASVATITIDQASMLTSSQRLGVNLTDGDIFTLSEGTGTAGYGIQFSVADGASSLGLMRHTNSGTDHYTGGVFYKEDGNISRADRDLGINLIAATNAVPEPSTALLGGIALLGFAALRRRS